MASFLQLCARFAGLRLRRWGAKGRGHFTRACTLTVDA